jgi:hypothetical protein
MSTKKQGVPCFEKAAATVRFWAQLLEASRGSAPLVKEARECANAMDKWPVKKLPD